MTRFGRRTGVVLGLTSMMFTAFTGILFIFGGRINTSFSIPVGLYWITKQSIQKETYVLFCPPQTPIFQEALTRGYIHSGFCPGGFGYMMKRVIATFGDTVSINSRGVWVNSHFVDHSVPHQKDEQERPLPGLHLRQYKVKDSELLLMTDQSELSFDARYFGVLKKSQVKAVIKPVLTWTLHHF